MNSALQKTLRLLAALVGLVGLSSCGGGGSNGPAEQTIALFSPIPDQRFSALPLALTALSSSGLAVDFSSTTASVCTVSGSAVRLVNVGTCTVAANQAGDPNFLPAPAVLRSFTVTAAEQTISFVSPGNQVFGVAPSALLVSSTSGLPVTVVSTTPAVCSVTGTTLTLLGLGNCSLGAVQAGNGTYLAAAPVVQNFAVNPRGQAQTISFASPGTQVLNVAPAALVASASSGLSVSFASTTPSICTVTGTTLSLLTSGSCTVAASQAGDQSFAAAAAVLQTFTVSTLAQNITFNSPGNQTLGVQPAALAATATSGLAVAFSSTTPAVCTVNGTVLTLVNVGNCALTASQAGNAVFSAAAPVSRSFSVAPAVQTITFAGPGNQALGAAAPALVATSSVGLEVTFTSTTPAVCTVSGTSLALVSLGTCTVNASQAGNAMVAAAVPVARSFQVTATAPTAQTISFASPGGQTLGVAAPALVATASSGLTVSFVSSTPAVCSASGTALALLTAGNCTVTASQAGNSTTSAATPVTQTFSVAPAAQTISFNSPGNQALGTPPQPLVASSSSGLPVSLVSSTLAVCSVNGSTLGLVSAGTCTLTASQAGNANVAAAAAVTRSFTVGSTPLASQTISFASPGTQTLGTAPAPLVASASSGLPVLLTSGTPVVCTVNGNTLTLVGAGACTVNASQAGNSTTAAAATVSQSFAVVLAGQSIAFASPGAQTLGTAPAALSATASSGLVVDIASTTPAVCTVNGNTLSLLAVGSCTVRASQAGNAMFAPATAVTQTFNITAAAQTLSFTSPGGQTLGTAPPALVASATSGLAVSFMSSTPAVCTVSGNTLTLVSVGSCSVSASQPGNAVFAAATPVSQSFNVAATPQTLTFTSPGAQTLGTVPPALSASASSGLAVSFTSTTPAVCTVNGTALALVSAGTCTVQANQAGNAAFAAATPVARSFAVTAAAQTITFTAPANQVLGTPPPALVATSSSGLVVSFASTTPAVCTVSGSTLTLVSAGVCTVDASQVGNAVFAAATPVSRSFAVAAATQTITFTAPPNQVLGTLPPALVATSSSGLVVSFTSTTPAVCTVNGSTLTLVSVGNCTVEARQPGNAIFAAAVLVSRTFAVSAAPLTAQTISFVNPGDQTLGTAPPLLSATATSGLPVAVNSTTQGVCTVSGNSLTLVAVGTCSLVANQVGNATFSAATPVFRNFNVAAAPLTAQTITFAGPGNQTLGTAPPALSASASSGLGVAFSSTTAAVCTVGGTTLTLVSAGNCSIVASQGGNGSFAPAPNVTRSFTVSPAPSVELFANGGFETAGGSTPADAWLTAANGYTRSNDARSGSFSAQLSSAAFGAAVMLQNSVEQGGRPALVVGSSPVLSFWAKGNAGGTGNVLFALRYLDGVGNIKANSMNQFFQGSINPNTWTRITYNLGPVPAGSVAAFIEFSQAIGPIDAGNPAGLVLIDDLSLIVP
jgi:hypothetical protein